MKIKDFKCSPVVVSEVNTATGLEVHTCHCILGNLHITKGCFGYYVNAWSVDCVEYQRECIGSTYDNLEDIKKDIQEACDKYLQKQLEWLETSIKYNLEDL